MVCSPGGFREGEECRLFILEMNGDADWGVRMSRRQPRRARGVVGPIAYRCWQPCKPKSAGDQKWIIV